MKIFQPNFFTKISNRTMMIVLLVQLVLFFCVAQFNSNELIPKPLGVLESMIKIISKPNFLDDFVATLGLIIKGMGIAIVISLFICYISLIPAFKYLAFFITKLRFLTYTGLLFVFTILLKNGSDIKIALLLFGIIPYFVTSLLSYIQEIPQKEYELCATLKFGRWRTLYEVIIKGRLHLALESIIQSFPIAFTLITVCESLAMNDGGLGTLIIKSNKYLHINDVFGVLVIVLLSGILFDYLFNVLKVYLFPYTDTKRYGKLWINRLMKPSIKK